MFNRSSYFRHSNDDAHEIQESDKSEYGLDSYSSHQYRSWSLVRFLILLSWLLNLVVLGGAVWVYAYKTSASPYPQLLYCKDEDILT